MTVGLGSLYLHVCASTVVHIHLRRERKLCLDLPLSSLSQLCNSLASTHTVLLLLLLCRIVVCGRKETLMRRLDRVCVCVNVTVV